MQAGLDRDFSGAHSAPLRDDRLGSGGTSPQAGSRGRSHRNFLNGYVPINIILFHHTVTSCSPCSRAVSLLRDLNIALPEFNLIISFVIRGIIFYDRQWCSFRCPPLEISRAIVLTQPHLHPGCRPHIFLSLQHCGRGGTRRDKEVRGGLLLRGVPQNEPARLR